MGWVGERLMTVYRLDKDPFEHITSLPTNANVFLFSFQCERVWEGEETEEGVSVIAAVLMPN